MLCSKNDTTSGQNKDKTKRNKKIKQEHQLQRLIIEKKDSTQRRQEEEAMMVKKITKIPKRGKDKEKRHSKQNQSTN